MYLLLGTVPVMMRAKGLVKQYVIYLQIIKKKIKIIRPFNFYGDYMKENDNRIIPKFISQAIKNKNITVFNKGNRPEATVP